MPRATVFVDAAVRGTLPPVCVKLGTPTHDQLTIDSRISGSTGLGVAWLLVLFGPPGWLGLIVIAVMRRPSEVLTVELPFSEEAYLLHRRARRMQHAWFLVAGGLAVLALIAYREVQTGGAHAGVLLVICALGAILVGLLEWRRARSSTVGVELDASHRWVTLTRVHPAFERAVNESDAPNAYLR